jgi:hypothetical protein
MISERLPGSYLKAERIERVPEALGIAKPAERDGSPARKSPNVFTVHVSPTERLNAGPEDGRARIKLPESGGDGFEPYIGIATGHDKYARSTEGFDRLAKAAGGDNVLTTKWVECVDQDDIDVAI